MLDWLTQLFNWWTPDWYFIPSVTVEKAIQNEGCKKYFITDDEYRTVSYTDIETLFSNNVGKFLRYRKDIYDCDDYARTASATLHIKYGNVAVGQAAIKYDDSKVNHMVNFFVSPGGAVVYIEPQTNKMIHTIDFKPYFMFI